MWMLGSGKTSCYQEIGPPSLFHCCSLLVFASGWSILHTDIMEWSVFFSICFFSKATLRGHLLPDGRKGSFPLEGDLFLPKSKNQLGIGLDSFQAMEITHLSGQQWKGFLWCSYLDFSISLYIATLSASSVALELIESWQKLASLASLNNFIGWFWFFDYKADQKIWPGPGLTFYALILKISHTI